MNMNITEKFDRKEFNALYETIVQNGNTALKPLAPLPARPHLYLVPKPKPATKRPARTFGLPQLAKCILGFVAFLCVYSLFTGLGALLGDLIGFGAVAYFSTMSLGS